MITLLIAGLEHRHAPGRSFTFQHIGLAAAWLVTTKSQSLGG